MARRLLMLAKLNRTIGKIHKTFGSKRLIVVTQIVTEISTTKKQNAELVDSDHSSHVLCKYHAD